MRDAGLHYCLFDPTGNITALVESAVDVPDQPAVAAGIMCRHPEVEQVGSLRFLFSGWPEGNSAAMPPCALPP